MLPWLASKLGPTCLSLVNEFNHVNGPPCLTQEVLISQNEIGLTKWDLLPAPLALTYLQLFLIALGGTDPFLNKPFIREDIWDCTEYFKNTTMKVTHLCFWDAASAVLRGDSLLPGLILRREKKRNHKSSPCLMNLVPFKLQTKRKEKKEVINLNKMEEERVDKLNHRHLEEVTFVQSGAVWVQGGRTGSARHPGSSCYIWGQMAL